MIASLPMYDWPELRKHVDHFWNTLHPALQLMCKAAPQQLDRSDLHTQWQHDELLLSQTCAYPLVTSLPSTTVVIGTPNYLCDFSENGFYASPILVRQSDNRKSLAEFENSTLAYNGTESQSGFNALKSLLFEQQLINDENNLFFSNSICAGSHRGSIEAVAQGKADICAVDPVSWALAKRLDVDTQQLRVLTSTTLSPALPLISAAAAIPSHMSEQQWRDAITHAFQQAIDVQTQEHLLLDSITYIPKSRYMELPIAKLDMITQPPHI